MFVDTGAGFNATEMVAVAVGDEPRFRISVDLSRFSNILAIRWDPTEGRQTRVALDRVAWRDCADRETVVDLGQIYSNGHIIGPAEFDFDTFDPMIFMPICGDVARLRLEGRWTIDDHGTTIAKIIGQKDGIAMARQRAEERIAELEAQLEEWRRAREGSGCAP